MAAPSRPRARRPAGARERVATVTARLATEYPEALCELDFASPFQLLVATILSAQTTDVRVNSVTPALFARYPSPEALAGASAEDVEALIRPTGFFRMKGRAIVEMSQDIVERFGGRTPDTMAELVTLRGVGRKTANVVLGVAFQTPGFPVDTHVTRLTARLGLTRQADPVEIERDVCGMVPAEEWTDLSLRLILHGRRVCDARRPRCDACLLNDVCPSAFAAQRRSRTPVRGSRTPPVTA